LISEDLLLPQDVLYTGLPCPFYTGGNAGHAPLLLLFPQVAFSVVFYKLYLNLLFQGVLEEILL
jgi:hypothetical protein